MEHRAKSWNLIGALLALLAICSAGCECSQPSQTVGEPQAAIASGDAATSAADTAPELGAAAIEAAESAATPTTPTEPQFREYIVQADESLWRIARRFYDSGRAAERLAALNGLAHPADLKPGMRLKLPVEGPEKDVVPLRPNEFKPYDIRKQRLYRVTNDESLWRIARRFYGDGRASKLIAAANGLSDPALVRPGMVIVLDVPEYRPANTTAPMPVPVPVPAPIATPEKPRLKLAIIQKAGVGGKSSALASTPSPTLPTALGATSHHLPATATEYTAQAESRAGNNLAAQGHIARLLIDRPKDARTHSEAARFHASLAGGRRHELALTHARRAQEIEPGEVSYVLEEIAILRAAGRAEDAAARQKAAEEDFPQLRRLAQATTAGAPADDTFDQTSLVSQREFTGNKKSVRLAVTLVARSYEREDSAGPRLELTPHDENFDALELAPTWLDGERYLVRIPVRTEPRTTIVGDNRLLNAGSQRRDRLEAFEIDMIIRDRTQCIDVMALDTEGAVERFDLCAEVYDADISTLGVNNEAFHYRRHSGLWFQGGLGLVRQFLPDAAGSNSSIGATSSGAVRFGAGAWYNDWLIEGGWREKVVSRSERSFAPRWMSVMGGHSFELPRFWVLTPKVDALLGMEYYQNRVDEANVRYLKRYSEITGGFRARFAFGSRLEMGGDYYMTAPNRMTKIFTQGDLRYWLYRDLAFGLGYWLDTARRREDDFRETAAAFEAYVRFTY